MRVWLRIRIIFYHFENQKIVHEVVYGWHLRSSDEKMKIPKLQNMWEIHDVIFNNIKSQCFVPGKIRWKCLGHNYLGFHTK